MTVIEKITEINDVLKDIFNFTQTNVQIKEDFNEYLATIGAKNIPLNQMEKIFLPYIFERQLNNQFIPEIYKNENKGKYDEIIDCLLNAQASIFEIKKILKNGFELLNLINEKIYTVSSLTKMTNFRGIYAGQYISGRIFELRGEFYIVEISSILSHSQKEDAYRYAVMKLIQNPNLLFYDNPEKETEIKTAISEMYNKFIKTFEKDTILTTNKHADDIIGAFNEGEEIDLSDKLSDIKEYKFFHVKELENNYSNFLENSMGGFSSHNETYDVAVIFDKDKGLYAIPFYETFCKIFENKDAVENAKQCVEYFLVNNSIPDTIIRKIESQYKELLAKETPNSVEIFYHDKPLKQHSLGQRASALVLFILSQKENDVVIIDQPEDDLDNKVIYDEVIKAICSRKKDIQFIFATHNANIPVLGDAEKILVAELTDDVITIEQGNIDNPKTHEQIVIIMEGGQEAFDKRKKIYSTWR